MTPPVPTDDTLTGDLFAAAPPPVPPVPPTSPPPEGSDSLPIHEFAERAYLAYAMSVVTGRALPSLEDGQKPVQRRILYAMRELGNRSDAPHKKSARIVGDVIGKFHPHGDSSVYEAAVRMAQDFTLRYPLIDGQGNFGSRDGDGAAAMRYTEVRLTALAEAILLAEIERDTVDFRDNYDGTLREPVLLPARLPVLLMNGASGIAVGMATEVPPHNLIELAEACRRAVLDPGIDDDALLACVPGPDFPGGAQLISPPEDIRQAYLTGRGSLRLRARWTVEPLARGQWRVIVHELPPGVSTARLMAEIEEIGNPKVKPGRKGLSPEQQSLKAAAAALIDATRDDSDQDHPVRLLIEPKSRNVTVDEMMAFLLANTSLEGNHPVNLTVLGRDRRPAQKGLPALIREWVGFRLAAVERRLAHRLTEVERRIHILDGRLIAFLRIEEVIRVIREADDPRTELMARFALSETQAEDILEIRLRQLARMEGIRIQHERDALAQEGEGLRHLLGSEPARRELVGNEIAADAERFGDPRRTLIEAAEKITTARVESRVDEPITVLLSRNGFIRLRQGHGIDRASLSWKEGDGEFAVLETRTVHPIVVLDHEGRAYTLRAADLPGGKGDGVPLASLIELSGRKHAALLSGPPETRILLASSSGCGFICQLADLVSRQKAGKAFMNVDGGVLLPPLVLAADDREIAAQASDTRLLVMPVDEIKTLSGGKGVQLIALAEGDALLSVQRVSARLQAIAIGARGQRRAITLSAHRLDPYRGHRARKGRAAQA